MKKTSTHTLASVIFGLTCSSMLIASDTLKTLSARSPNSPCILQASMGHDPVVQQATLVQAARQKLIGETKKRKECEEENQALSEKVAELKALLDETKEEIEHLKKEKRKYEDLFMQQYNEDIEYRNIPGLLKIVKKEEKKRAQKREAAQRASIRREIEWQVVLERKKIGKTTTASAMNRIKSLLSKKPKNNQ